MTSSRLFFVLQQQLVSVISLLQKRHMCDYQAAESGLGEVEAALQDGEDEVTSNERSPPKKKRKRKKGSGSAAAVNSKPSRRAIISSIERLATSPSPEALREAPSLLSSPEADAALRAADPECHKAVVARLVDLLPVALGSRADMRVYMHCVDRLESAVLHLPLPFSFFRAALQAADAPPARGCYFVRKKRPREDRAPPPPSPRQLLWDRLGIGGVPSAAAAARTTAAAMCYGLLRLWEGSADAGKSLFQRFVLQGSERDRTAALRASLEVLLQVVGWAGDLIPAGAKSNTGGADEETETAEENGDAPGVSLRLAITIFGNFVRVDRAVCVSTVHAFLAHILTAPGGSGYGGGGGRGRGSRIYGGDGGGGGGGDGRPLSRLLDFAAQLVAQTMETPNFRVADMVVDVARA
ncbi:unnamed protein product, partial [Phaeothamnion confervicola]